MTMKRRLLGILLAACFGAWPGAAAPAAAETLRERQQDFVDLKFGMFIHFNIPTFADADWPDPDADPAICRPEKLDCRQWADAARAAKMRFGCLTTKHHSGFCIWDTQTTDYGATHTPFGRDVVREYVDAFRAAGLKVMLYYSILDTHHRLRPGHITRGHVDLIRRQLTELLTNYGPIEALVIDGWDAPWSRISYETIPFAEIYGLVKELQPDCLVMDLNAAKYPAEMLCYTDIKSYEQNAGQHISAEENRLPALSCLPINKMWFWKTTYPTDPVKDPERIVRDFVEPYNRAYCTYILNVAPNRDGLIDDNAVEALRRIGRLWDDSAPAPRLPEYDAPIVAENIAKHRPVEGSWSDDMWITDFGNDDDFETVWRSHPSVGKPWYEVTLDRCKPFNTVTIYDPEGSFADYRLKYLRAGVWYDIPVTPRAGRAKIHRFDRVWGERVRIEIDASGDAPQIAEFGVYDEMR